MQDTGCQMLVENPGFSEANTENRIMILLQSTRRARKGVSEIGFSVGCLDFFERAVE